MTMCLLEKTPGARQIGGVLVLVEKNDSGLYHEIVGQDSGFIYLGNSL
jgi:hypothetical protein